MSRKMILRMISTVMLCIAAAFIICAFIYPQFDMVFHIGPYVLNPDHLREGGLFPVVYIVVMAGTFVASFFTE